MSSQLDAIKARAEAATEGPWTWSGSEAPVLGGYAGTSYRYSEEVIEAEHHGECGCRSLCQLELTVGKADAEFIAHSRADIPALVAAVEAVLKLHKEVQWAESWPTCIHCNDGEGSPLAYPCPTVAAIRTALGEGEK